MFMFTSCGLFIFVAVFHFKVIQSLDSWLQAEFHYSHMCVLLSFRPI